MRRTDCEAGSPRVRFTTARFRHAARRRGGRAFVLLASLGARAARRARAAHWRADASGGGLADDPEGQARFAVFHAQRNGAQMESGLFAELERRHGAFRTTVASRPV
jgi:hypothetical protein